MIKSGFKKIVFTTMGPKGFYLLPAIVFKHQHIGRIHTLWIYFGFLWLYPGIRFVYVTGRSMDDEV